MALSEIRRRPTLPGRFQPSTISVLRLNFCVRDGNRCDPFVIATGNCELVCQAPRRFLLGNSLLSLRSAIAPLAVRFQSPLLGTFRFTSRLSPLRASLDSLRLRFPCLAPSKPHRFGSLPLTDHVCFRFPLTFPLPLWLRLRFRFSQITPGQVPLPGPFPAYRLRFRSRFGFSCSLFPSTCSLLLQDQALDRLVSPSSIRYRTSTDDLSTLSSSRGLTHF